MPEYIVHIHQHFGWETTREPGETFAEAAVAAVVRVCKERNLNLDEIPHAVEYRDRDGYQSVVFYETSRRRIFGGYTYPGEYWFSDQVRQGHEDDCLSCGGTGVNHYNPFRQCWSCGDQEQNGKSSGKLKPNG